MRGPEYLNSKLKFALDYAIAGGAIPATSPLWLTMYCYNRMRGEPLLFPQERIGKMGQPFMVLKFETLYSGAEATQEHITRLHSNRTERENTDPRIPNKAMAILRQTGLNEVPQVLNVLRGEMSIVGPRPLPNDYLNEAGILFPEIMREWRNIALRFKPGIVGVNPLKTRRIPVQQFEKIALSDIQYCEQATFWKDLSVIAEAMTAIVKKT
jgi:lipopolysaccharide/colanic/teichoic acid biosynthesis glycosyltransferase